MEEVLHHLVLPFIFPQVVINYNVLASTSSFGSAQYNRWDHVTVCVCVLGGWVGGDHVTVCVCWGGGWGGTM